ncbi:hypothetical protein ART_2691 [Arthrobacter sp. PAMC 25486]|nr:hypothetical protein ART_2691 [Arthrobacter sp. PAMC 25486]
MLLCELVLCPVEPQLVGRGLFAVYCGLASAVNERRRPAALVC